MIENINNKYEVFTIKNIPNNNIPPLYKININEYDHNILLLNITKNMTLFNDIINKESKVEIPKDYIITKSLIRELPIIRKNDKLSSLFRTYYIDYSFLFSFRTINYLFLLINSLRQTHQRHRL